MYVVFLYVYFMQFFLKNDRAIGLMSRVFASGWGDQSSIPGRVIPKTKKMVLDAALLNIQNYKVSIKGKAKQSKEWCNTLHYTSV